MKSAVLRPRRSLLFVAALGCVAALVGIYLFFVLTELGQTIDERALEGAAAWPAGLDTIAAALLQIVPIASGIAGLALVIIMMIARRNATVALVAIVAALAANGTTQLLKLLLDRPDAGVSEALMNSLPSGHTTLAASVAIVIFFVSPPRIRPVVGGLGALGTAAVGAATLLSLWHRPSDVIAALLVVAFWACAAAFALGGAYRQPVDEIRRTGTALLAAITVIAAVAALFSLGVTVASALTGTSHLLISYAGGVATIVTGCFGLAWWGSIGLRWLP